MKTIIILNLFAILCFSGLSAQTLDPESLLTIQNWKDKNSEKISGYSVSTQKDFNQVQYRSDEDVLDSLHTWTWDTLFVQWQLIRRTIYTSDENNNVISELNLFWESGQWINESFYTYSYDDNNNITGYQFQVWNGTVWENSEQTLYTYDDHNNQTSITDQNWDGSNWVNSLRRLFTYDDHDKQVDIVYEHWTGTDWQGVFHHIFTYDVDHRLIHRLIQNWNNGWVDNQQIMYSYDLNNDLDMDSLQRWVTDHWEDYYRNFYTYDAHHNRTEYLRQLHIGGGVWEDEQRFFFTYDLNDDITSQLYQTYTNGQWVNFYQFLVTNDENRNRITEVFQIWDGTWVNQDSFQYYYTLATGTKDILPDPFDITVYPNPASSSLEIQLSDFSQEEMTIEIYSDNGILQMKSGISPLTNKSIDISGLASGEYHVMIRTGKGLVVKNFVKF